MNAIQRTELIVCMEAGTSARAADVDHGDNPHLAALRAGVDSSKVSRMMGCCSAWWDGWEEAHRTLSPAQVWRENFVCI